MESRRLAGVEVRLIAARDGRDMVKHPRCTTALSEPLDGGKECHYSIAI